MAEKEYIERGAVLNAISALAIRITPIEENRDRFYHDSGWNGACVGARVEVGKTPAADVVEFVHARWIWNEENECFVCSNCELSALNDYRGDSTNRNYCPNCGAKMDGATDNNVGDKGR